MLYKIIFVPILFIACNPGTADQKTNEDSPVTQSKDLTHPHSPASNDTAKANEGKVFFNRRFRDVMVTKIDTHKYDVRGQAQMFEASFEWAVNNSEKEIKTGYGTTDAGAPAWGTFRLTIQLEEKDLSAPLTLILFESSARDGSRQHLLEIELE